MNFKLTLIHLRYIENNQVLDNDQVFENKLPRIYFKCEVGENRVSKNCFLNLFFLPGEVVQKVEA